MRALFSGMPTVDITKAENLIYRNYAAPNKYDTWKAKDEGQKILAIIVKKDGTVRASKPKVKADDPITGKAAYVWRMVCFLTSPKPAHSCMPTTCHFDLPAEDEAGKWKYSIAREIMDALKPIEDAIVDSIDKSEWHGVRTWGRVFGTPRIEG
jgi:hypothetical protein